MMALRKVDVRLVEDGGPLERGAVQPLARRAVAVFGGEGARARDGVADRAAVAFAAPFDGDRVGGRGEGVGGAEFPLVFRAVGG